MSPEERREAILLATTPLLREHGANVTTSQIAKAAGIAEGTVFRAFKDKQELLLACLERALSADAEVARIRAIPLDQPLTDRLIEATAAITDYMDRLWSMMQALRGSGFDPRKHDPDKPPKGPQEEMPRIAAAMAQLFEPERARLRLAPERAARLVLGLTFTSRMQDKHFGEPIADPAVVVELFLHGLLDPTLGGDK
jgi:AcrR family transcriptional regulator